MDDISIHSAQSLFIEMQFDGQKLSTGTAFVVYSPTQGPHLITNRHNVTGRNQNTGKPISEHGGLPNHMVITHNKKGHIGKWIECVEPLYDEDVLPRWVEHPVLGPKADFVALKLTQIEDVELFPYDPKNPNPFSFMVRPADIVSVIGFPFGLTVGDSFAVWATGFLASEPTIDYDNLPVMLIDCRTRQGQSGSPVIAYRSGGAIPTGIGMNSIFEEPVSCFLGIYSGRVNKESDLGIVWKATAINELIEAL